MDKKLDRARDIIRNDPSLIWYTKSYDQLDIRSITEAVLTTEHGMSLKNSVKLLASMLLPASLLS